MRLTLGPMTPDEFAEALRLATAGEVRTDTGADDRTNDAVTAIAILGATSDRVAEARAAFVAMWRRHLANVDSRSASGRGG